MWGPTSYYSILKSFNNALTKLCKFGKIITTLLLTIHYNYKKGDYYIMAIDSQFFELTEVTTSKELPTKSKKKLNKIDALREANKDFDTLVSEIDTKIENYISEINNSRSFNPVPASSCTLKIFVTAIPFTAEERQALLKYLTKKYITSDKIGGFRFKIKKCLFSNRYRIITEDLSW